MKANNIVKSAVEKPAPPPDDGMTLEQKNMQDLYYDKMPAVLRSALYTGLLVGGGGGAVTALYNYLNAGNDTEDLKNLSKIQNAPRAYTFGKSSSTKTAGLKALLNKVLGGITEGADKVVQGIPGIVDYHGIMPTTPAGLRAYWPLVVGAGGLGAYGGYRGATALGNYLRKGRDETDLAAARKDFNEALAEEYRASHRTKQAMEQVDDLYEPELHKESATASDYLNEGMALQTAGSLLTWYLVHNFVKKHLKSTTKDEMAKNMWIGKQLQQASARAPAITFNPPVATKREQINPAMVMSKLKDKKEEDEPDVKGAFTPAPF